MQNSSNLLLKKKKSHPCISWSDWDEVWYFNKALDSYLLLIIAITDCTLTHIYYTIESKISGS